MFIQQPFLILAVTTMNPVNSVASNIRNARQAKSYSQDYLAYKLKISQNAYSKIECGHSKITVDRLIDIAQILEIEPNKLLGLTNIKADVEAINRITVLPELLKVICRITGMGFAAVARVTENKWVACRVNDEISFGLKPGDELQLETTICNEIRQSRNPVVIDHVDNDKIFVNHPTPAMYGFQSYISIPIIRHDGTFFGTLCAIDPKPAKLNSPEIIGMFQLFADLISFHLDTVEQMAFMQTMSLEKNKVELREQFIALMGHELPISINAVLNYNDVLPLQGIMA